MQLYPHDPPPPDVYSLDDIARAAGVPVSRVEALVSQGRIVTIGHRQRGRSHSMFVIRPQAVEAVRALTRTLASDAQARWLEHALFAPAASLDRSTGAPLALSSLVHAGVLGGLIILSTVGLAPTADRTDVVEDTTPMRLVFVVTPGPGGGGGGGGLRQRTPPPKAERQGTARVSSPLPPHRTPEPVAVVETPPEPIEAEPLPTLVAPVVTAPADTRDRAGLLEKTTAKDESRGPGVGGGVGTGSGAGLGEGNGSGIGPGSGGGTGGGPYRPGSGVAPPRLLHEVKPDYTEDARRHGVEGEVVMEVVVRHDGSVGDVRLVSGLGYGLNDRAMAAVRQWRFSPAQRRGLPVDVLVEVAVEFKLR
jgi:periplasmic protein TonB